MSQVVQSMSPQMAAFLGYFAGIIAALAVVYIAAFINAHFKRKRDEQLREDEMRAIAGALSAELGAVQQTLRNLGEKWRNQKDPAPIRTNLAPLINVFPQLGTKLSLFPKEVMAATVKAYALIGDYESMLFLHEVTPEPGLSRGKGTLVSPEKARIAAKVNDSMARRIQQAIDALAMPETAAKKKKKSLKRASAPMSKNARDLQVDRVNRRAPGKVTKLAERRPQAAAFRMSA